MYKLHGVLVHSGDLHGGHYFALIKPEKDHRWLKFDDDRVTPVTEREVLEENFGGEPLNGVAPITQRNQIRAMKRFTNAYMLVYVREASIEHVLAPFTEKDTPPHLSQTFRDLHDSRYLICHLTCRTTVRGGTYASRSKKTRKRRTASLPHSEGQDFSYNISSTDLTAPAGHNR